jgi:1-acyl-sn-glycerol-3-phosphate acyltransferase
MAPQPAADGPERQVEALAELAAGDLAAALGQERDGPARRVLALLARPLARPFAERVAAFDRRVGRDGLAAGAAWLFLEYAARLEVVGLEHLPPDGPLLVAVNHPGMTDTLAMMLSVPRADLRLVAEDRPFLRALPHTQRHLLYVPERAASRAGLVRRVATELRRGGAVVAFSRGRIEPDPAVLPGAVESLADWSPGTGVLARLAPGTRIVPAIVSGVLSPAAQRSPLTRLRRGPDGRQRLGSALQLLWPGYRDVTVRVAFGPPIAAPALPPEGGPEAVTAAIRAGARGLIEEPPRVWRTLLERQPQRSGDPLRADEEGPPACAVPPGA